ncbi:MAG: carboxylate-amine ligase [Pseudomonadota bacterium]
MTEPSFTLGIEEEYLLVDQTTKDLVDAPLGMMDQCFDSLGEQVSREFKRCQVEIGTKVCGSIAEAREDLKRLRAAVRDTAAPFGVAPLAISCHPFADWKDQPHTDKERYNTLAHDLAGVSRRMLISGMHVHVGIEDPDLRIDLMNQAAYFLPHLLALSGSSPFWQGEDTGLSSYRLTVFDNLPRTGLPPRLVSHSEFERSVQAIIDAGAIEDASKIWWDLRPSSHFPTLEMRICDNSPQLEHTLILAALYQSTLRMLWRLGQSNQRWRIYDAFLIGENRWRALRYGMKEGLIDFGRRTVIPFADLIGEWIDLVREDAVALGCLDEVEAARLIVTLGNGADRQRALWAAAQEEGKEAAMRAVVAGMEAEYSLGL